MGRLQERARGPSWPGQSVLWWVEQPEPSRHLRSPAAPDARSADPDVLGLVEHSAALAALILMSKAEPQPTSINHQDVLRDVLEELSRPQ